MRKQCVNSVPISEAEAENYWHIFYQEISSELQAMTNSCDQSRYKEVRASQTEKVKGARTTSAASRCWFCSVCLSCLTGVAKGCLIRIFCPTAMTTGQIDPLSPYTIFWLRIIWTKSSALKKISFIYLLPEHNAMHRSLFVLTVRYGSSPLNADSILVIKNHYTDSHATKSLKKISKGKSPIVIRRCTLYWCS